MPDAAREDHVPRALACASRHARAGRVEDVQREIEGARTSTGVGFSTGDDVYAGMMLAQAYYNSGRFDEAGHELDRLRPLVRSVEPVRQGRYHALAGIVAHGRGDDDQAIGELLGALGVLDGEQDPT